MFIKSPLLEKVPGIAHGFGTEAESVPAVFEEALKSRGPKWKQVHGIDIAHVESISQECGNVDAVYSALPGVPVGMRTADCVPILMAEESGRKVVAIHAGWRGTYGQILRAVWNKLASEGERPEDWVAAIGPSIGPCCYEVSEELLKDFREKFTGLDWKKISPTYRHLDLPAINEAELSSIGFKAVDVLRMCTRCSTEPKFHSYRRSKEEGQGEGGRQLSVIMLEAASNRAK